MKNINYLFLLLSLQLSCQSQTNIMNKKNLEAIIRPQIENIAEQGWKSAKLEYFVEDLISGYELQITKSNDEVFIPTPIDYSLCSEETNALNSFIKENCKKERCNKVIIKITSTSFSTEVLFLKEKYDDSERLKAVYKREQEKTLKTIPTKTKLEFDRYIKTENKLTSFNKIRILPIDAKVFSEFYTRLYTLFGEPNYVGFEGFAFYIFDSKENKIFEPCLTGFGALYYTEDESKATQKMIDDFHNMIYSEELELKECELKYGSDFGQITLGYSNGKFIYKEGQQNY